MTDPSKRVKYCIVVLCGIPGAGKSFVAKTLQQSAIADGVATTIINFDALCGLAESESSEFDPEKWKAGRALALEAISNEISRPISDKYHLIIVDDTMHYRSMRAECFKLARAGQTAYFQLHIDCSLEQALARNKARDSTERVPEAVLRRTYGLFEAPEKSSCAWDEEEYNLKIFNSSPAADLKIENEIRSLLLEIWRKWKGPVPPLFDHEAEALRLAAARQATANDTAHALDIATRKILNESLSQFGSSISLSSEAKGQIAAVLNAERRKVLENLQKSQNLPREAVDELVEEFRGFCDRHCDLTKMDTLRTKQ